jgi:protein involved in polysaccharide export with SLBB domain
LAILALAGCSTSEPLRPAALAELEPAAGAPYLLQRDDQIAVKFYRSPELNEDVTVRPDGMISLQLIGDVPAAGLTPTALSEDLARRYRGELSDPRISVIVRKPGGQRVYVGGEVGAQGEMVLNGGLTLFQAIQKAGGFLKTAHRKQVILIRRDAHGRLTAKSIDVRPIQSGDDPGQDLLLEPYDVVFVPRSKIANVNVFVEQYIRNNLPINYLPVTF